MPSRKGEPGAQSWYRIVNLAGDGPTQVQIYDEIGFWGVTAQDFLREVAAIDGAVEVHINSPGGDVFDAFAIYNGLASRPGVTTVVDGVAASAASVIAMAGETRLMARTSQLMIHDGWAATAGNAEDLQHMVDRLQTVSDQIAGIYADAAGGETTYWRGLMRDETWFTPQQALAAGLITGIIGAGRVPTAAAASLPDEGRIAAAAMPMKPGEMEPDTKDPAEPGENDPKDAVDTSPWDASKAWSNGANSDDPAAFYAGICAGKKAGDKSTQAAWALPYKYHPSDPPNAGGVRAALSRLPQTQGLTNEAEARATLEAAMRNVNPDYEPPSNSLGDSQAPGSSQGLSHVPPGSAAPTSSGTQERNTAMPEHQDALTIEARRSRIGDIAGRFQEIAAQYPASVLPTDVQAEWDQLVAERREHQSALDAVEARNAVLAEVHAGRTNAHERTTLTAGGGGSSSNVGAPAVHVTRDIYDLAEIRQQAHSAADLPRLYRENAIRAIDVARFPGNNREDTQERVVGLLDTVHEDTPGTLARRILATGSPGYKQAFGRALAAGNPGALGSTDARILALGESDTGSYAVPFELDPTVLLTSDGAINPLRAISRVVQITGKEYDLVTSAGVTVSRKAEFAAETDGAPTLAQPTVKPERVSGFIPFSVEIEGDWSALQAEMMALLRDAKDVEESASFTNGDGTPPAAGGVIATLDSGSNVAGSSGALNAADPQKLEEALAPRFRTNASFVGSKTTLNAYRTLLIAAGYTYDAYVQATQGTPRQLFGYNAYENSDMITTHASGDTPLIFGDFKRGFIIVDRVGMNMELVPHLFGASQGQFPTGRRGYFAWWRNNSRVLIDNAFRLLAVA